MIQESELGKRIKEFRMKKGLTLQKLEEKTGFTKGYLSKVENTKKAPPVSTLIVLAKALEVSLSEIFGEKEEKSSISLVETHPFACVCRIASMVCNELTIFGEENTKSKLSELPVAWVNPLQKSWLLKSSRSVIEP